MKDLRRKTEIKNVVMLIGALIFVIIIVTRLDRLELVNSKEEKENILSSQQVEQKTKQQKLESQEKRFKNRKFSFHNKDGSLQEEVYFTELLGTTEFTEGAYQYELKHQDIKLLQRVVFAEAGTTEGFKGQVAIAAEVLNRLEEDNFPNTIQGILAQENQYYKNGIPYWVDQEGIWRAVKDEDVSDKVKLAVELALEGADPTEKKLGGNGALFHYSPKLSKDDGKKQIIKQITIGNHNFYRDWTGYPKH